MLFRCHAQQNMQQDCAPTSPPLQLRLTAQATPNCPTKSSQYALMVRAPAGRAFQKNEAALRRIQQSFTLV